MTTKDFDFPLTGPINLQARLGHGSLRVEARDDASTATVRLSARDATSPALDRFRVEFDGPTLVVLGPRQGGLADVIGGWHRTGDAVDVLVAVPSNTAMRITTASADVAVSGRSGGADIVTGTGEVTLDEVAGDLRLRRGNGRSSVGSVSGSVQLRGGQGLTRLGVVFGNIDAGFGNGELVTDAAHGSLRCRGGAGSIAIGAVHADVDVALGSGSITLGLPVGVTARVDMVSGSGQVYTDLPVEIGAAQGRDAIAVRVRTGHGVVRLQRPEAAA